MLLEKLGKKVLLFDGAMGTQLQNAGLKTGEIPEEWNVDKPDIIKAIHSSYLHAGANIISTNTFGCNALKMKNSKYSLKQLLTMAIKNANAAKKEIKTQEDIYIAYDMGPIGELLEPIGTLSFDEAYEIVKEQIMIVKNDVDVILLETMTDIYELKAAILAIKENCDLPIFASMTFEENGRTLTGSDPTTFITVAEALGVKAVGVNCSLGPKELTPIIDEMLSVATVPVFVQANAGLPVIIDGKTTFPLDAQGYALYSKQFIEKGVALIGGCCGTTPTYIEALRAYRYLPVTARERCLKTRVSSARKTITFDGQAIVCGERLNPTGKKKLKKALLDGNYDEVMVEAINQEKAGADILDVNVGVPGIEEAEVMKKVIKMIQEIIDLPLQIDSSSPEAIEQACRYYNGKPLINSVNGKPEVMEAIFPIIQKYGGVVIGLTLDTAIPMQAKQRVEIANTMIKEANRYKIDKKDIIIDCLTLTASAQQKEVNETLKAVKMIKKMGIHTVLGVSNVSFGLPNRSLLNRTFLTLALDAGLDLPILNPLDKELMGVIDAYNVIKNLDTDSATYIERQTNQVKDQNINEPTTFALDEILIRGLKEEVVKSCKKELESKNALAIINTIIIPALTKVGEMYEQGIIFLPQLIQSAETTKVAFNFLQEYFKVDENKESKTIMMATVEGDIHDIGKNIVKVVVESYGYHVIDLGKNVPINDVVEAYQKYKPDAIGLSALMTTTVISMKKTIESLHQLDTMVPILVGGAVLNEEMAREIKADYYCKDAMETVRVLQENIVK